MRLALASLTIALVIAAAPLPVSVQVPLRCDFDPIDPAARDRRMEGLTAVRLINQVLAGPARPRLPGPREPQRRIYPTWEELATAPEVENLVVPDARMRKVAVQMRWGSREPLPGWLIHYVAGRDGGYAFSLRDSLDRCGFGYASDDAGRIVESQPVTRLQPGVVPLGS